MWIQGWITITLWISGTKRTITRVWKGRKGGICFFFRRHTVDFHIGTSSVQSNGLTVWFSLGSGDWAIAMSGWTAGYDVSSCATAVWHVARLGPKIPPRVTNCDGLVFTQEMISLSLSACCCWFSWLWIPSAAHRVFFKAYGKLSFGNLMRQLLSLRHYKPHGFTMVHGFAPSIVTQLFWNGFTVVKSAGLH